MSYIYVKLSLPKAEVLKLWGAVGPWGGGRVYYVRDIYFEWNMCASQNIYFDKHFAWLQYFNHQLAPVLALFTAVVSYAPL
jgi:hypothetical protein